MGLTEQTAALNATADGLVRASTINGALLGAAAGCGLAIISKRGAERCVAGAAIGAAAGAAIGNAQGKRDVARRVEIADPSTLVIQLRKANTQMDGLNADLPTHLAMQDAQVQNLDRALASGQISQNNYDRKIGAIREDRAQLAHALTLTAGQARKAAANLQSAASEGQTGLDWHILTTNDVAEKVTSARSSISLL